MGVIRDSLDWTWPVGKSDRIRECDQCIGTGNSNAVQVTRKEDGFLWHCFRCDRSGFYADESASPDQVQQMIAAKQNQKPTDTRPEVVELPDYSDTFQPQGLVDLFDLHIDYDDIDRFNIGWSNQFKRTIFPLYKYGINRKLVGWAGKKLSTDDDKSRPKWHIIRQRDITNPRFIAPPVKTDKQRVVLVEDPHSAIRVSQLGYMAIGLLTTYLPYELYKLFIGWEVKIWFDEDALDKSTKYQCKLGANGITSTVIHTVKDPKEYSPSEIKEIIKWQI